MFCLNCFHDKTKVVNSRPHKKHPSIWRRRRCVSCNYIFTTYEQPRLEKPILQKTRKPAEFNLGKLTISIYNSFKHAPETGAYDSFYLAQTVQLKLLALNKDLSTEDIASVTHETLNLFDPVAAVQYAAQHDLIRSTRRPGRPSTYYPDAF